MLEVWLRGESASLALVTLSLASRTTQAGVVMHPCDPNSKEVGGGGSEVQGHPQLHSYI